MTDKTSAGSSKTNDDGELWSFLRSVLSQGGDIWLDHAARSHEQYSARLDAAARERVGALKALISPSDETFVIPVSPHMPKRERPAKAPSKSGLRYQQELAHYCGFRWQWLNLPPSEQLETLLEQLADAKDDALRLHHAYVDLKFPEMARPELKANALQPIPATEDDISHWWKCLNCHARNDPETYPVSCPCCATLRPTQNGGAERG